MTMTATMTKSLVSDSNVEYVQIQAYVRENDGTLHIQGIGPPVNREYGISADISLNNLETGLVDWIRNLPRQLNSQAGTGKLYFVLQMRYAASVNRLNFQVPYDSAYNKPYGANFSVLADMQPGLKIFWDKVTNPELANSFDDNEIED